MYLTKIAIALLILASIQAPAEAQDDSPYNQEAGQNLIYRDGARTGSLRDLVPADRFGNPDGNQFDLAKDGAFVGKTLVVLQLYTREFDFRDPTEALEQKGFQIIRWTDRPPPALEMEKTLRTASQFWLISDKTIKLSDAHVAVIKAFFDRGHGVYIWGDNEPYYADANQLALALLGSEMRGNLLGDQVVGLRGPGQPAGLIPRHLLTTGIQYLYEGITIATIERTPGMQPLIYGSAGNLVAAFYDHDGKRAVIDGGFTRLYNKWDTAGTGRYVANAAAWLANHERFPPRPSVKAASPKKTLRSLFEDMETP